MLIMRVLRYYYFIAMPRFEIFDIFAAMLPAIIIFPLIFALYLFR